MKHEQAREKKRAKLEQMLLRKQRRKQSHFIRKDDDLPGRKIHHELRLGGGGGVTGLKLQEVFRGKERKLLMLLLTCLFYTKLVLKPYLKTEPQLENTTEHGV